MAEKQDIEYKQSWRDEYIKWVCGFANAKGGKIFIGIDDKGIVTGIADAKKLMEEIPNKIKDILGILADVNLKTKSKKNYLQIVVKPYPYPISYKGSYYYRSGSTMQELKGAALDKFILQKQGKRWDGVPQTGLVLKDLSKEAFASFKKRAKEAQRVSVDMLRDTTQPLLEKLHLFSDKKYLKRAAVLLFHHDPEKYITGAFVKIGFFNSDHDLAYQDEVHGHLFDQVEKTMQLLLSKYLKAEISYKGIQRHEKYPVPEPALREALLNAIVHKDYSQGVPVQISVYRNKIIFWNPGELPDQWTVDRLIKKHPSHPFNPDVANCFFLAGLIEAWGRGTIKILDECKQAGNQAPGFIYDSSGVTVEFGFKPMNTLKTALTKNSGKSNAEKVVELIANNEKITIPEMATQLGVSVRTINRLLNELQQTNKIKREGSLKSGKWKIV